MKDKVVIKCRLQDLFEEDVKNFSWNVPGIHVEDEVIPRDAINIYTSVIKLVDIFGGIHIQVIKKWTIPRDKGDYIGYVNEFSTIENLRIIYPKLFELEGVAIFDHRGI